MKNTLLGYIFFMYGLLCSACSGRMATVEVAVVDDSGKPVEGATVRITLSPPSANGTYVNGDGVTGSDGRFSFTGEGHNTVHMVVTKAGWYESRYEGLLNDYSAEGRGKPVDPKLTLILRPIQNPVKMYYWRRLSLPAPALGKAAGLDMEKRRLGGAFGPRREGGFILYGGGNCCQRRELVGFADPEFSESRGRNSAV